MGDADTTTEARAKKAFNEVIAKSLDKNHVMKNLGNALFGIKKDNKVFSTAALCYIKKCVRYAIATSNSTKQLKLNLDAIVPHAFNNHDLCKDVTWCKSSNQASVPHVYKSLPGGKPLTDDNLKDSLTKTLNLFTTPVMLNKLLHLGSTQANENFNQMVAQKVPKAVHYSDSPLQGSC